MKLGLDIGGVSTKISLFSEDGRSLHRERWPWPVKEAWPQWGSAMADKLASLQQRYPGPLTGAVVSVTAELSDAFASREVGVAEIVDAVEALVGPSVPVGFVAADGALLPPLAARRDPWRVAAANWYATARYIGQFYSDAMVVDIGSTTTDIIPVRQHRPCPAGRTDFQRLQSGELLYLGIERTPLGYLVHRVPWEETWLEVAGEVFCTVGDAWRVAGWVRPGELYHAPVDGRTWSRDDAGRRLVKAVLASWDDAARPIARVLADYVVEVQVTKTQGAIERVRQRHQLPESVPVFAVGQGALPFARYFRAHRRPGWRLWAPPSACWSSEALAVFLPQLEGIQSWATS
ncbi:MAG: hypothetical protein OWU84_10415 [Firmicutes bacterium]|nr:hypothetical protein [Bacillota bacterium]